MINVLFKYIILFCTCLHFTSEAFSQEFEQIAFLKFGTGSVTVEEIELYKDAIVVDEKSYLFVLSIEGRSAKVIAWGKRVEPDSNGLYTAVTGFIDINAIVLFHKLDISEQKTRIEKSFSEYSAYLKSRKYADGDMSNYKYESNFSPMRDALLNYWNKTKEPELLSKYFAVVELNDGAADGGDSRTLRDLFISDPEAFANILKRSTRSQKKYIKYRVSNASGWVHPNEQSKYIDLIEKYLKDI